MHQLSKRTTMLYVEEEIEQKQRQENCEEKCVPKEDQDNQTSERRGKTKETDTASPNIPGTTMPSVSRMRMRPTENRATLQHMHSTLGQVLKGKALTSMAHTIELTHITETHFYTAIKPLFLCQMACGTFFVRSKERSKKWTPSRIYCTVLLVVLFLNLARSLLAFTEGDTFGTLLFFKIKGCIFWYECFARALLGYIICLWKKKGLEEFFITLDKVCFIDGIVDYEEPLKRLMKGFIGLTVVLVTCNVGITCYGMFGPENMQRLHDTFMVPLSPQAPGYVAAKILVLALLFFNTMIAGFTMSFFTVVCYILYREFRHVCMTFSQAIMRDGQVAADLEKFRVMHQKRCQLVEDADTLFKIYVANTYLTNIPLLCLLMYNLVYSGYDTSHRVTSAFWIVHVSLHMMVVSVSAIIVNIKAHDLLWDIYNIRAIGSSNERHLGVTMFLNRLTGTQIGLTAWDMFVINKPAILTVIGMVVTYFFLLVQFKNPLQTAPVCKCVFNATE